MKKWFGIALMALMLLAACGGDDPTRHNEFAPLTAINVSSSLNQLAPGTSVQLVAEGIFDGFSRPITNECRWESSNTAVATVDETGRVRALAYGRDVPVTITASHDGIVGTIPITVTGATIESVAVSATGVTPPATASIPKGRSQLFTAVGTFIDGTTQDITLDVTWSSENTAFASIVAPGTARGVGEGTTNIRATFPSVNGAPEKFSNTSLQVTAAVLEGVVVEPANQSILSGATQQFTAKGRYSDGTTLALTGVIWSATPTGVATIDTATGLAKGAGAGTATITATLGEMRGTTNLTVAAPTSITISDPGRSIARNENIDLTATATFSNNQTQDVTSQVNWTSSRTEVATVDNVTNKGRVTGQGGGTTEITAAMGNITARRNITVR